MYIGLPCWLRCKESSWNAGERFNPLVGKIPGEGHGNPLQCLAWSIPWTEEPGKLQSRGSQRVGHNWSDLACTRIYTHTHTHTHTYLPYVFSIANKMMLLAHSEKAVAMGICIILLKNNLTVLFFWQYFWRALEIWLSFDSSVPLLETFPSEKVLPLFH